MQGERFFGELTHFLSLTPSMREHVSECVEARSQRHTAELNCAEIDFSIGFTD
jgi:hypothetical protein